MTLSIDSAFPIGREFDLIVKFHKLQVQRPQRTGTRGGAPWPRAVLSHRVATSHTADYSQAVLGFNSNYAPRKGYLTSSVK